jgi:hypothetical protein
MSVNWKGGLIMVTKNKRAGEKKRRVKVGKLENVKELSAADIKKVRGGDDKKPVDPPKPAKTKYLEVDMNQIIVS